MVVYNVFSESGWLLCVQWEWLVAMWDGCLEPTQVFDRFSAVSDPAVT